MAGSVQVGLTVADWPGGMNRRQMSPGADPEERWFHVANGVTFNYGPRSGWLRVEASLPKVLLGENYSVIGAEDEQLALEAVECIVGVELRRSSVRGFPDWAPSRLDAVRQVRAGTRARLGSWLRSLRDVEIPRWGSPVVGQAGSCTWGLRHGQRARAYDKWREVEERGSARGAPPNGGVRAPCPDDLLRVEGVLRRPNLIRRLMGSDDATVAQAVRSGVAEGPLMRVWPTIERIMEGEVREDDATWRLVKKYGWTRTLRLVGFARVVAELGVDEIGEHLSRGKVWADMKALRDAGVEPTEVEWATGGWLARPMARATRKVTVLKREQEAKRNAAARRSTA